KDSPAFPIKVKNGCIRMACRLFRARIHLWHNWTREAIEMKRLLKFYKFAFAWENYLLLVRAIGAAQLVRAHLGEAVPSPHLASSLRAVERLYLPPQPGWRLSDPERVVWLASFVVNMPSAWGKCVQQSLIAYRLLNGYGFPAEICFSITEITQGFGQQF